MKEYEFVVRAIEEDFCDQLMALICYENYSMKPWEGGHKRIFDSYGELYDLIRGDEDGCLDLDGLLAECCGVWERNRDDRLEKLLKDLKEERDGPEVDELKSRFFERLGEEDVQTPEKRAFIYPYLIETMREWHSQREMNKRDSRV